LTAPAKNSKPSTPQTQTPIMAIQKSAIPILISEPTFSELYKPWFHVETIRLLLSGENSDFLSTVFRQVNGKRRGESQTPPEPPTFLMETVRLLRSSMPSLYTDLKVDSDSVWKIAVSKRSHRLLPSVQ
jgi:hypothetical protein